jgi:hypothetical protein
MLGIRYEKIHPTRCDAQEPAIDDWFPPWFVLPFPDAAAFVEDKTRGGPKPSDNESAHLGFEEITMQYGWPDISR